MVQVPQGVSRAIELGSKGVPRPFVGLLVLVLIFAAGLARAAEEWIHETGVGSLTWGSTERLPGARHKAASVHLPDAGWVGKKLTDTPDDWEIVDESAGGERRFVRYQDGALIDAWILKNGPLDPTPLVAYGEEEWRGPVLGPDPEPGWRSIGDATSWRVGARTVFHWRARSGAAEALVSRAVSGGQYGVQRAAVPKPRDLASNKGNISGTLKKELAPAVEHISGCFNDAEMPVEARVLLEYDSGGRPARLRVESDRRVTDVETCVAGALLRTSGPANGAGYLRMVRLK
jgi:hypothetical protein